MKTFKINRIANRVNSTAQLLYDEIVTSGDGLCMIIDKDKALEVSPGGKLHFEKYASGNTGDLLKVCERDVEVFNVSDDADGKRYIYFEYPYIEELSVASFSTIVESGQIKGFKIYFNQNHGMVNLPGLDPTSETVATDFDTYSTSETGKNYTIYVVRGENIIEFSNIELCYPNQYERGKNFFSTDGYCCPESNILFNYDTMEKNSVIAGSSGVTKGNGFTPSEGDKVLFCTNQYFWTNSGDSTIKMFENVTVSKYVDFMGLNLVLEDDYDAKRMFQEHQVNDLFVEKIKKDIVPDFIDLEKVKYAPAYRDSGGSIYLATGLTFNLHFRTRVMDRDNEYTFEDTWHTDSFLNTWNGNTPTPVKMSELYSDPEFVNSSNIIGYLGFTDDDIYNQKNRVKQSFLRLSFYDSDNPLEQELLFYSTIFMDSGDLFGKFVKRKTWLTETGKYDKDKSPAVWSYPAPTDPVPAITSQFIVNDEYDTTRSGEGFNLYLFKQDAPLESKLEPIYMKVEFNHAGYGRTVPMIHWKTDLSGIPETITTSNYFENLYIPVKIGLTEKGYVYMVQPDERGIVWKDDRLIFNLFEPRIETEGAQVPEITDVEVPVTGTFEQSPEKGVGVSVTATFKQGNEN